MTGKKAKKVGASLTAKKETKAAPAKKAAAKKTAEFSSLVKGWGDFELFVADLYRDTEVVVTRGAKLIGKSGSTKNIDVLITGKDRFSETLTVCECKYWNKRVPQAAIGTLLEVMRDVNANKGAIFSAKGFQKGARKVAAFHGINLYMVRALEDHEWGAPGRIIDFTLQGFSRALKALRVGALTLGGLPVPSCTMDTEFLCKGEKVPLSKIIDGPTQAAMRTIAAKVGRLGDGGDRKAVVPCSVEIRMEEDTFFAEWSYAKLATITVDFCIRVDQCRIYRDRADSFPTMVEEVAKGGRRWIASKRKGAETMQVSERPAHRVPALDPVKNGEVAVTFLEPWFPIADAEALERLPIDSLD